MDAKGCLPTLLLLANGRFLTATGCSLQDEEVGGDVFVERAADALAGDSEFVGKMYAHYNTLMDQAGKYLSSRYDESNRSVPGKASSGTETSAGCIAPSLPPESIVVPPSLNLNPTPPDVTD